MRSARFALRAAASLAAALGFALGAHAQSMTAAEAPAPAKAAEVQAFKMAPGSVPAAHVRLQGPAPEAIDAVKQANSAERLKPLQIGIGQEVASATASDTALPWMPAPGGIAAHWQVSSTGAKALRVALDVTHMPPGAEIRFAGSASIGTVYGPVTAADILKGGARYWSPVLEGDTATIEVFVPGGQGWPSIAVGHVSHLFVSPSDPRAEQLAKASGACEVDFICRAASDAQLAQTGRSVARMTFGTSGTSLCTGTLLNPSDNSFTPYFHSAAHCISTQSVANTLTTHWFYENSTCGGSSISTSYAQVTGGASLLHANTTSDASFMRLNGTPPSGAVYAGWDAATVASGTALTAIHHPQGDPKKVSLGTAGGFGSSTLAPGGSFLIANWNSLATGVTEGGSSGSGIFSGNASAGYRFRGGLLGGPSSCSAAPTELYDYYSRFDQVYGSIAQYLNPGSQGPQGPNVVANPGFESGATAWTQSSSAGATIITSDAANARAGSWYAWLGGANSVTETLTQDIVVPATQPRLQFWYRISTNETSSTTAYDTMAVTVNSPSSGAVLAQVASFSNLHATSGWVQSSTFDLSAFAGQTVRLRFVVATDFSDSTSFRIDDVSVTGTTSSGGGTNYTALWYKAPAESEAGWGMNFVQQGDIAFATLFTYDSAGAPMWLFMSGGTRQGTADTFSGALYRATGPAFFANPFTSITGANLTQVGTMTVAFSGASSGTLTYSVNGVSVSKSITKQVYGAAAANCVPTTGSRASATNYQDLWWNAPANSEAGWGLNITHQGNILFGTLFTYGSNNRDLWLVMSAGVRQPDGSYLGELYQTAGPPFNAQPWTAVGVTQVGTMRLRFSNGETGTLEYTAYGITVTKTITRQVFSSPVPICSG